MGEALKKVSIDELKILKIQVSNNTITAHISDGRVVSIPIAWFSRLSSADSEKLSQYEISPSGYGVHWPLVDEDISIKAFINP